MTWRCGTHGALDEPWCDDCDPHENCDRVHLNCGDTVDRDCDDILIVNAGGDGADWLHPRGECPPCDRLWEDVDANAAYAKEMSWFASNFEPTAEVAAAECAQALCDGELHYTGRRDPITNEDVEIGPCPEWKAAA